MGFRVFGRVLVHESGIPVPDLMVSAYDSDLPPPDQPKQRLRGHHIPATGDVLGTALTDEHGRFELEFSSDDFDDGDQIRPDLLLAVFAPLVSEDAGVVPRPPQDRLLHFSTYPWFQAGRTEGFVIRLRQAQLAQHGISTVDQHSTATHSPAELLRTAISNKDAQETAVKSVARELIAPRLFASLANRDKANQVAFSYSTVERELRGDPLVVPDTMSSHERRERLMAAELAVIEGGVQRLADAPRPLVAMGIDPDLLRTHLPEEFARNLTGEFNDVPVPVTFDVMCRLMHEISDGYSLSRTRSLGDVATRLRRLRGDAEEETREESTGETVPTEAAGEAAATVSERIQALVEAQVADVAMTPSPDGELPTLPLQRLRAELEDAVVASGPADTTAYHDLHTIQLAYQEIWVEALNPKLKDKISQTYLLANKIVDDLGVDPAADEVLPSEIEDIEEYYNSIAGLVEAAAVTRHELITDDVRWLWPEAEAKWHLFESIDWFIETASEPYTTRDDRPYETSYVYRTLGTLERAKDLIGAGLEAYPGGPGGGEYDRWDFAQEALRRHELGQERISALSAARSSETSSATHVEPAASPIARLRRLLNEMSEMLTERYAFTYYAAKPPSVNFGIVATYRQRWVPGEYQVGDLVDTVPLAPGESRRLQVREFRKTTRATKELEKAMWSRAGESSRVARATTEIVRRAEASTNFTMTSQGSFNFVIGSVGGTSSFSHNQSSHSQATKSDFREAVIKASHEYRNERTLEVSTSDEDLVEATRTGEVTNPNNEVTVTYLLYELERQYHVSEQIHRLQPVVLVAQPMPSPGEITEAWLLRHEWILRRVLLDDSLEGALDELHEVFAGEEAAIAIKRANWEAQLRIAENLEGEHSRWLSIKRELNKDLIDATYQERAAEAAEEAGGILADIGHALTFDIPGAVEAGFEARRKSIEEHLKWVHDELQQSAEKLAMARESLDSATKAYGDALERRIQRRTQIDQLRVHVKDNVLYYMQAIWSHEPPDQRYFRLHNVSVIFPQAAATTCWIRPATPDEEAHPIPGVPGRNVVVECEPPVWDGDVAAARRKLHQVAELDKPLGFKGNYMIFPLRECSLITDYMMLDYVDTYFGIRDSDRLSEFTTQELIDFRNLEPLNEDERASLEAIITARLSSPRRGEEMVVVPTGSLYMEALVGSHTLLEPFKLAHRGYDAARAREDLRRTGLENLRYAARLVLDEPILDDPEVDRRVMVAGDGETNIEVDVP